MAPRILLENVSLPPHVQSKWSEVYSDLKCGIEIKKPPPLSARPQAAFRRRDAWRRVRLYHQPFGMVSGPSKVYAHCPCLYGDLRTTAIARERKVRKNDLKYANLR